MSIKHIDALTFHKNSDGTFFVVTNGFNHIKYWGRCELNEKGNYNPLPIMKIENKYIFGIDLFKGKTIRSLDSMIDILNEFKAGKTISRKILLIGFEEKELNSTQINSLPGGES